MATRVSAEQRAAGVKKTVTSRVRGEAVPPLMAEVRRPPGRARSDASRVAILGAALGLLESTPLQQISIESIAREAGVGKATIYRWWKSKAEVVIDAFMETHASRTPMPKGVGPVEALTGHMHLLIEQFAGWSGRIVAQILAEGQGDPTVLRQFRERFTYGRRAMVREVVEEARRAGLFRTDVETELQMDMLYAPIYLRLLIGHLPLDRAFADQHCETVLRLMTVPRPPARVVQAGPALPRPARGAKARAK